MKRAGCFLLAIFTSFVFVGTASADESAGDREACIASCVASDLECETDAITTTDSYLCDFSTSGCFAKCEYGSEEDSTEE